MAHCWCSAKCEFQMEDRVPLSPLGPGHPGDNAKWQHQSRNCPGTSHRQEWREIPHQQISVQLLGLSHQLCDSTTPVQWN